jgi:hypothetical protein
MQEPEEGEERIGLGALIDKIESEPQEGNIEYKFMLVDPTVSSEFSANLLRENLRPQH